jgi:hypothetical protein
MKRVGETARAWVFAVNERERDFLVAVLQAYPAVPPDYQPLSRESADRLSPEDEALLHEALREHRAGLRSRIRRWLGRGARFRPVGEEWQFKLVKADLNWMLQALNDVRVGYWIQLGSPEDIHDPFELLQKDPAALFHMEAAGLFEMQFLQATHGDDSFEETG